MMAGDKIVVEGELDIDLPLEQEQDVEDQIDRFNG
jgi:hypothetical protein